MLTNEELSADQVFELSKLIRQIKQEYGIILKISDPHIITNLHHEVKNLDSSEIRKSYRDFLQLIGFGNSNLDTAPSFQKSAVTRKTKMYRGQVVNESTDDNNTESADSNKRKYNRRTGDRRANDRRASD